MSIEFDRFCYYSIGNGNKFLKCEGIQPTQVKYERKTEQSVHFGFQRKFQR
jgi:hypothetical protein